MALEQFKQLDVENVSELTDTINVFRQNDIPCIVLGPPGIGKSDAFIQATMDPDDILIDLRTSQLDPIDVRGMPTLEDVHEKANSRLDLLQKKLGFVEGQADFYASKDEQKAGAMATQAAALREQIWNLFANVEKMEKSNVSSRVVWSRPEFWPMEGRGIVLLEEINTAVPAVQNTLLQPLGAQPGAPRLVGTHVIPNTFYWAATGNRKEDLAHVVPTSSAFRNRVILVNIDQPNLEGWTQWALDNQIHPYVVGFIRFKPDMLYQRPEKNDETVGFPTPRSWSRIVSPLVEDGYADVTLFKGGVGGAGAVEFHAYMTELKDMPDIDKLLAGTIPFNAEKYKISIIYAIVTSLVSRCRENVQLIKPAMNIVGQVQPEHAAIFVSNLLRSDDKKIKGAVVQSKEVISWAQKHRMLIDKEAGNR